MKKTVTLEASTNTHIAKGNVEVVSKSNKMGTITLKTNGQMIVEHGEHAVVATEPGCKNVIKIVQQEYSPILKQLSNAFD